MAVHGLAYLGVLLLFAGVFGLIAFSFSDVRRELRPVAEATIPVAVFAAAWVLQQRGSHVVGNVLELLGALLLPVVVVASFLDGASFPPDLTGVPMVIVLAGSCLVLAAAYAALSRRDPGRALRFAIGPTLWAAAGLAGLATERVIPHGQAVGRAWPWQMAVVALAIPASLLAARRIRAPLRRAVEISALPGIGVASVLIVLALQLHDWPAGPAIVAGLGLLVAVELLAPNLPSASVAAIQTGIAAGGLAAVAPEVGVASAGAAGVVVGLGLGEWERWRRPSGVATIAAVTSWVLALLFASLEPWPAVTGFAAAAIWANLRRVWPSGWIDTRVLTLAAAFLPVGIAAGLFGALPAGLAVVVISAAVASLAVAVRIARASDDRLWGIWIPAAAAFCVATVGLGLSGRIDISAGYGSIAAGLAALALLSAPRWPVLRVWTGVGSAALSLGLALEAGNVAHDARLAVFGVAGLVLAMAGSRWHSYLVGHIGATGLLMTTVALAATTGTTSGDLVAQGAFTASWLIVAAVQETTGSSVVDLLARAGHRIDRAIDSSYGFAERVASTAAPVLAALGVVGVIVDVLDGTGTVARDTPEAAAVVSLACIGYACLSRWPLRRRAVSGILGQTAFWLALVTVPAAWSSERAAATSLAAVITVTALLDSRRRRLVHIWSAWALSAPLTILVARISGAAGDNWYLALLVWGSAVLVGVLAWDDWRDSRRVAGEWVRARWRWGPTVMAAVAIPAGLAPSFATSATTYGWWSLEVAVVAGIVAWQLHIGAVSAVGYGLVTVSYLALASWHPLRHPWSIVPEAALLLLLAAWLELRGSLDNAEPWRRWDLPAFVAAHGVGAVALLATARYGSVAVTFVSAGALVLAIALQRPRPGWLISGNALVLAGAMDAGHGWALTALLALSLEAAWFANRRRGWARTVMQGISVSAVIGGFAELYAWLGWAADQRIAATAIASGGVVLVAGVALRLVQLNADWAEMWGVPALVSLAASVPAVLARPHAGTTLLLAAAAGTTGAAVGLAAAAKPLGQGWLREGSSLLAVLAAGLAMDGFGANAGQFAAAALAVGVAATAAAVVLHRATPSSSWLRPLVLAVAVSAASSVVASIQEPGWGAVALLALSAELTLAATYRSGLERAGLQVLSLAAFAAAGVQFGRRVAWSLDDSVAAASLTAGGVALIAATGARWAGVARDWVVVWGGAAIATLLTSAGLVFAGTAAPNPSGRATAAGLALAAAGAALAATPLGQGWLREGSSLLVVLAALSTAQTTGATLSQVVAAAAAAGLAAVVCGISLHLMRPSSPWTRPLVLLGGMASVLAVACAVTALPARDLLVPALLVVAAECAAVGVAFEQLGAVAAAPAVACAAWLLFASEALAGSVQWLTVPIGVTLLLIDEIVRAHQRAVHEQPAVPATIALEYTAMGFIVAAALLQEITVDIRYGVLAVALGVALGVWGLATRVRRRAFTGASVVALAVLMLVAVPVRATAPHLRGPGLWLAVAITGFVAILAAMFLEQRHTRLHESIAHLSELLRHWE